MRRPRAGRRQLLPVRTSRGRRGGGPGLVRPGLVLPVPLRLGHRVRLHRHVEGGVLHSGTGCSRCPKHWAFLEAAFAPGADGAEVAHPVRAPSAVQRRTAASQHPVDGDAAAALPARRGARRCSAGTSTTFSTRASSGIDYFVTGGGGRARAGAARPLRGRAHRVVERRVPLPAGHHRRRPLTVRAIGEGVTDAAALSDIVRLRPRRRPSSRSRCGSGGSGHDVPASC